MKRNSVGFGTQDSRSSTRRGWRASHLRPIAICCLIFFCAVVVRTFHWQDNPTPPFHGMTGEYKAHAMTLVAGDVTTFLRGPNPPSNAHVIKHPPGYPLLMAVVYRIFGDSDGALRFLHILLDALSAVLVCLIAYEMFSIMVAGVSGFLVALSPQLAYHSVALLPDPLAAPPLLLAAWLLVRAYKNPRLLTLFASGLMIGISCLFRSNTLLLPLFVCGVMPLLFKRGRRSRFSATFLLGFFILIVPVTIRNAVYFHSFIPVSLSAGITLVEGIGAFDKEHRFGLPDNDYLVSKWEAQEFGRPDYLGDRFGVDGVARERYRMKRGFAVVTSHPGWFLKVMAQRAVSMLRLARVEVVKPQPAVRSSLSVPGDTPPSWTVQPVDQANQPNHPMPSDVTLTKAAADRSLRIEGPSQILFSSKREVLTPYTEYLLRVPLRIERGALVIEVLDAQLNTLARSPVLHPVNWLDLTEKQQPEVVVGLPFVSGETTAVEIRVNNGSQEGVAAELGNISAYKLGPASQTWTRYPRIIVRLLQKPFITAVILPFTLLGLFFLIYRRRWPELAILLVLPIYYMCVQSALWTEFRYILSMHYFLFILAAVGFVWGGKAAASRIGNIFARSPTK